MVGRRPKFDRPKRLTAKLPTSLLTAFEDSLFDPGAGRIPVGARQAVLARLLRCYLRGQDAQKYYQLVEAVANAITSEYREESLEALLTYHESVTEATRRFETDN